jgi:DNA-binding NtrC family response regulator
VAMEVLANTEVTAAIDGNGMVSRLKPSLASEKALVVSRDVGLARKLQGFLRQDHCCDADCVNSYFDAEQRLRGSGRQCVFLDLRPDNYQEDPSSLLDFLVRQDRRKTPVVSIGCDGYRCEWADLADSTVCAHLRVPFDRDQLERVLRQDLLTSLRIRPVTTTDCRQVQTNHITYRTYTPQVFQVLEHLTRVAIHDVTILLVGETGTGKTTLARMVHDLSPRAQGRFYALACGALPPELIESELFGHVKGAFTGAERNKEGKFEIVNSGTLLLDEIDCLDQNQQMKLLRVIETGEFERVGCNETQKTNARLIAASNVDLRKLVDQGQFRPDLYYRLSVLEFKVPPLRDRPYDIVPLTLAFVEESREKHGITIRRIHPEFLQRLRFYDWPGNIRELKNHVGRAVLFSHNGQLTPNDLAPTILEATEHGPVEKRSLRTGNTLSERVASTEQEMLARALEEHGQNRTATARALGISRVGLYKKMKKYGMLEPKHNRIGGAFTG